MNNKTLNIILDINGGNQYTMKYPETCAVKLELARSADYWGVFISVVESFTAIKEDREFINYYFDQLRQNGYAENFNLNVDIQVKEYDNFISIYKGVALPAFEDDTLRINLQFSENSKIASFLDGTYEINVNLNDSGDTSNLGALSIQAPEVISGYRSETGIEGLTPIFCIPEGNGSSGVLAATSTGGSVQISAKAVLNLDEITDVESLTQAFKSEPYQAYFVNDEEVIIPKNSTVKFNFEMPPFFIWQKIEGTSSRVLIAENLLGSVIIQQKDNANISVSGDFELTRNSSDLYFNLFGDEITAVNNTHENQTLQVSYRRPSLDVDATGWGLSFRAPIDTDNTGESGDLYYLLDRTGKQAHYFRLPAILTDFQAVQPSLFNVIYLIVDDSFLPNKSDKNYKVNVSNVILDVCNTMSWGVEYSGGNFLLKHITSLFEGSQSVEITEDNVFNLSISLNDSLTFNQFTCGAQDRNYKYPDADYDHTRNVTYNARNQFSGVFDKSIINYKAQSNDLCDLLTNFLYEINEESKEDDNIVLFNSETLTSGTNNITFAQNFFTPARIFTSWSWLLKTVSPLGWDLVDNNNLNTSLDCTARIGNTPFTLGESVDSGDSELNFYNQRITLRVIRATIKLTTTQYNTIVENRNEYITINYKGVQYKGYINVLSLDVGKNMIAEVELLEKYE